MDDPPQPPFRHPRRADARRSAPAADLWVLGLVACLGLAGLPAQAQDFNGNGVRDSLDLRTGTSPDCNRNGTPDEADIPTAGVDKPDFRAAVEHASDTATSTNVAGVTLFDADGDGDRDAVVSSRSGTSDSALTVWRNDGGAGGGTGMVFGTRHIVPSSFCWMVRHADLNGDGRPDLVASDAGFPQVVVMLATPAGGFAPAVKLVAGSRGTGIALADLDNDGDIDIASAGAATNAVDIFRNTGNGSFGPRTSFACGQQPSAVAAGDFTGDGFVDLAVANSFISAPGTGTVTLLRNKAGATFAPHATLTIAGHAETSGNSAPHDLALADIDADGDADLLVSSKDSNSLRIYTNAAGSFANTQTLGPLDSVGAIADRLLCTNLDGDAAPELAWGDSSARCVRLYDNDGGTFVFSQSYATGSEGPVDIAAGDLGGDGLADLAFAGNTSYAFSTMRNLGGAPGRLDFDATIHFRRTDLNFYPFLADLTGDGATDLVTYATFDVPATLRIAPGLGGGHFGPAQSVSLPSAGQVFPRDLDNDGDLDILSLGNSGNWFTMLNTGGGGFGGPKFPTPISVSGNFQTADLNGDGFLDALWTYLTASNQPGFIRWRLGNGQGSFGPQQELQTFAFLGSVWTGDLTGDGAPELFVGFASAAPFGGLNHEKFLVYTNLGNGTFGPATEFSSDLVPSFAAPMGSFAWADVDGDADGDLLAVANGVWLFRNDDHTLAPAVPAGGFANYGFTVFGPAIADADEDGDLDFFGSAVVSGVSSSPTVFFNDGNGSFGGGVDGPRLSVLRHRAAPDVTTIGDADDNGRPDILVKPNGYGDWYLHLNERSDEHDCNANGLPDSCDIASGQDGDADGDGVPDSCDAACAAEDLDCDGMVGATDLAALLAAWGAAGSPADLDADGVVGATDLARLLAAWGR